MNYAGALVKKKNATLRHKFHIRKLVYYIDRRSNETNHSSRMHACTHTRTQPRTHTHTKICPGWKQFILFLKSKHCLIQWNNPPEIVRVCDRTWQVPGHGACCGRWMEGEAASSRPAACLGDIWMWSWAVLKNQTSCRWSGQGQAAVLGDCLH